MADMADNATAPDSANDNPQAALAAILNNEGIAITTLDNSLPAAAPVPTAVEAAQAAIAEIEAAQAVLSPTSAARTALDAALAEAQGTLALAQAEAELEAEKAGEIMVARLAGAKLPPHLLAAMLDAVEMKYAPAPPAPEAAPVPEAGVRRGPSDRTLSLNAAASADTGMQQRAAAAVAAFNADSAKLSCNVNRLPNTRFSGMVALAPSSAGAANYADYDSLTRAIRWHLVNVERWPTSPSNGQSVPEAKWLAARGRYIVGSGNKSALDCFNHGAEIAQYPDGRFRWAYPGTAGVRFLRTDNAAWQAFVGSTASVVTSPVTTTSTPAAPIVPTPPAQVALPNGGLASTARCQACTARNVVGASECSACGESDWMRQ